MVRIVENSGESPETAILILDAANPTVGIGAEYEYLSKLYGVQHRDWRLISQALVQRDNKLYDRMQVGFPDGDEIVLFFDITDLYKPKPS
jgi:hypothetical protein